MLKLALALFALTQAEPEQAGLTDAWFASAGAGSADLWLALEGQPLAINSAATDDGALELTLERFACASREILPPAGRPVSRLNMAANGQGDCIIRLEGQWSAAQAFLGEGGILVSLDGVAFSPVPLSPVAGAARTATDTSVAASPATEGTPETAQGTASAPNAPATSPAVVTAAGGACEQSAARLDDTPWDLAAMSGHGDCLAASGRTADAETLYERVLAFEPGHYGAALGLARLRAAQGDTAAAAALFQTAADSARTDGEALAARSAAQSLEER
ncbi:MAG: tetratricopeptide repeat protein [Glycocaulis sp.]